MKKQWQILQPDINSTEIIRKTLKCSPVSRIHSAISDNEKILVFSDYDVDGVTTIVLEFLLYICKNMPNLEPVNSWHKYCI